MIPTLRCAVLAAALSLTAAGAVIDDCERTDAGMAPMRSGSATAIDAPGATGGALRLAWPADHGDHIECAYQRPLPAPSFAADADCIATLRAASEGPCAIARIGIRFIDSAGETFQWVVAMPDTAHGWRTIAIPLPADAAQSHWGPGGDGAIHYPLRLAGYALEFAPASGAGALVIDDIGVDAYSRTPAPVAVRIAGASAGWLNDATARLALTNAATHDVSLHIAGSVTDVATTSTPFAADTTVGGGATVEIALPIARDHAGLRIIDYALTASDGTAWHGADRVAVGRPCGPGDDDGFRFGIAAHLFSTARTDLAPLLERAAAIGADVMRFDAPWQAIEPQAGVWRWDELDAVVAECRAHRLACEIILGFGNSAYAPETARAAHAAAVARGDADAWLLLDRAPPEDAAWRRYVAAVVGRYRDVRCWEVWNEPDSSLFFQGTTDDYVRLLRSAHDVIHAIDRDAVVLSGGFATVRDEPFRRLNPDLQARVLAEAGDASTSTPTTAMAPSSISPPTSMARSRRCAGACAKRGRCGSTRPRSAAPASARPPRPRR